MKANSRETYDDLLNKLMSLIPRGDEEGLYTDSFRIGLLSARLDLREGRLTEHDRVKKRLDL